MIKTNSFKRQPLKPENIDHTIKRANIHAYVRCSISRPKETHIINVLDSVTVKNGLSFQFCLSLFHICLLPNYCSWCCMLYAVFSIRFSSGLRGVRRKRVIWLFVNGKDMHIIPLHQKEEKEKETDSIIVLCFVF